MSFGYPAITAQVGFNFVSPPSLQRVKHALLYMMMNSSTKVPPLKKKSKPGKVSQIRANIAAGCAPAKAFLGLDEPRAAPAGAAE